MQTERFYEFADFRLDVSEKILTRGTELVPLTPKVFDTLLVLVENPGRLLEKDEFIRRVWQDRFVEEGNLAFNIKVLRKALDDSPTRPQFIETVQRRGYRFIANVEKVAVKSALSAKEIPSGNEDALAPRRPYFLLSLGIILLISLFGIAFVWFNDDMSFARRKSAFTRLTNSGKVVNAAVGRDGKILVFAQKEDIGESLWLRQIDTGDQTQILPAEDVEFVGLAVSPDNRFVYYSVFSRNSAVLHLSRIALNDNTLTPLADVATDVSVSFSPDGKRFAFTESHSGLKETHLKIADADGSNQKVLTKTKGDNRMFPVFKANPVAWSPDGEKIACAVNEIDDNGSVYRILLVDPSDGSETYLSDRSWNNIESVVWKDAETLAFIEYEENSPVKHIWQASQKTGEARQLTNDLNGYKWLSSAGGSLFALQSHDFSSLQLAEFAEAANTLQPKQIFGEASLIENVGWSQDGKIFYNSWASGKNEIWQINTDGTTPQQLTTNSNLVYSFAVSPIDDKLIFSSAQNGKTSLLSADPNGQNIRQLTGGTLDMLPVFSPDGKNVFFQRGSSKTTLWSIAPDRDQEPVQLTGYQASNPSLSPDGKQIAFHFMDFGGQNPHWKLGLIDTETRRFINKLEFPVPIYQRKTVWHPKTGLLTMSFNNGANSSILLWSATGGEFQTIDNVGAGRITSFAWSPDGTRLVFSQNFETSDVVSLDNF